MHIKQKILNESLYLFSDLGYEKSSMRKLAERVGVKAASLYNHYQSKEHILLALRSQFGPRSSIDLLVEVEEDSCEPRFILSAFYKIIEDQWLQKKNAKLMRVLMSLPEEHKKKIGISNEVDELKLKTISYFNTWKKAGLMRDDFSAEYYIDTYLAPFYRVKSRIIAGKPLENELRLFRHQSRRHLDCFMKQNFK